MTETSNAATGRSEFIAFRIRDEEYCIEITAVREIRRWTSATRLPHAPEHVSGVINLRGAVVPVIDFATRLGKEPTTPTQRHPIIIVECGGQVFGLLADAVSDILTAGPDSIRPTPSAATDDVNRVVTSLIIVENRMLRIVNTAEILDLEAAEGSAEQAA